MNWLKSTVGLIVTGLSIALIVVAFLWLAQCSQNRQRAAQSKVDRGQAGAFQNSAADAVNTVSGVAENQAASEELTRRNTEEIRHAKGADAVPDPGVSAAGVRALCRRAAYRNTERCRLLQPHP